MMSVLSVVTMQNLLHLRGTIAEAISMKPQSVFAVFPYFSVFSRKKLQDEGKGKSLFPRISPYFPMFPPLPAYEYTAMQE
ncbi:HN1_G0035950.mRNA.1.CDS.1 [Saccharomyces cerevisiae]|nr:HN1_G0035950.mRNA.1.CDS.1 [Saccharomyces cerevisiae]CAI4485237.1 BAL_1a_G0022360.mRNA.1.CDS.1 [Saccharomyces cerevisiae]CAI7138126.1 BAL_1a_G0022360.mRNA.1.CDS.1 [Saccharomyces cerevisiae]